MKQLIIKIIKGIIFGYFILSSIYGIFNAVSQFKSYPGSSTGGIIGILLFLLLVRYLLYKCKYKIIKGLYHKFSNWTTSKKETQNS